MRDEKLWFPNIFFFFFHITLKIYGQTITTVYLSFLKERDKCLEEDGGKGGWLEASVWEPCDKDIKGIGASTVSWGRPFQCLTILQKKRGCRLCTCLALDWRLCCNSGLLTLARSFQSSSLLEGWPSSEKSAWSARCGLRGHLHTAFLRYTPKPTTNVPFHTLRPLFGITSLKLSKTQNLVLISNPP